MSNTRHAADDSVFHQNKFASSEEYERGLVAYLVAKRCSLLDDRGDRELIWFVQYLSHQEGGLAAVVKELLALYPERFQTDSMMSEGIKRGMVCDLETVKKIRPSFPHRMEESRWPLWGEFTYDGRRCEISELPEGLSPSSDRVLRAQEQPAAYAADVFFDTCTGAARANLETAIGEFCLNPAHEMDHGPWYFPGLVATLRDYHQHWVQEKSRAVVVTSLGQKIYDALDYTSAMGILTLMQGEARRGKTFSARAWCAQHPGRARFIEVPTGNDQSGFYKAIARGLGLGNFLRYKAHEIKERIEAILLTGDLMIVMDEAHRLWPQKNLRYSYPERITWLMAMANHNVPICAIATPQFTDFQRLAEQNGRWNSAQLTGRISHYPALPADLSPEDLKAVAHSLLPSADADVLAVMAAYARTSARYLAAIEAIANRATYLAMKAGRTEASTADVRTAIKESVIPSDNRLVQAMDAGKRGRPARLGIPSMEMPRTAPDAPELRQDVIMPAVARGGMAPAMERRFAVDLVEAPKD